MRTLKFTHKEIELLIHALGIAENANSDLYTKLCRNVGYTRGMTVGGQLDSGLLFFHKQACKFADLNSDIAKGQHDV